jgi:hypothetical protein
VVERYEDADIEKYLFRALLELGACKRCWRAGREAVSGL